MGRFSQHFRLILEIFSLLSSCLSFPLTHYNYLYGFLSILSFTLYDYLSLSFSLSPYSYFKLHRISLEISSSDCSAWHQTISATNKLVEHPFPLPLLHLTPTHCPHKHTHFCWQFTITITVIIIAVEVLFLPLSLGTIWQLAAHCTLLLSTWTWTWLLWSLVLRAVQVVCSQSASSLFPARFGSCVACKICNIYYAI